MNNKLIADWKYMLDELTWINVQKYDWPEWELHPVHNQPFSVGMHFVNNDGNMQSRDVAIEWDDVAEEYFYYRDVTNSGHFVLRDGENYNANFYFQSNVEAERFRQYFWSNVE